MGSIVIEGESGATEAGWSAIQDFLRCPKAYQFSKVRQLHKPPGVQLDHFAVGSLVHAGRAKWYALGFPDPEKKPKAWAKVMKAMELEGMKLPEPPTDKAMRDSCRYVLEYAQHWKMRPKPKPLATEYKLGPAPLLEGDPKPRWRTARLDDLSYYDEAGGKLCIGECKTTSASLHDITAKYTLHGQIIMQTILWDASPQGRAMHGPIAGVVLDVVMKGYGTSSKFGRTFIPVSDWQKKWFAKSMSRITAQAIALKEDSFAERRTTGCQFPAGRILCACDFKELCSSGRSALGLYRKGPNHEKPNPEDYK